MDEWELACADHTSTLYVIDEKVSGEFSAAALEKFFKAVGNGKCPAHIVRIGRWGLLRAGDKQRIGNNWPYVEPLGGGSVSDYANLMRNKLSK